MAQLATLVTAMGQFRQSRKSPKVAPPIPLPDDEELQRARRRMAAAGGSRASTILTDSGGLGG